jgi:glyoxylase-like metal-dependent hydrolase (beta-lactamase superfamily II)
MDVQKVREGLWRWLLPHPAWTPDRDRPGGWGQFVGSVYYEAADALVLIDPLAPAERTPDAAEFWKALDADVLRLDRSVVILIGSVDHGRAADRIAARYRKRGNDVAVVGSRKIRDHVACRLTATLEQAELPAGVEAHPIVGMSPGEVAYVLKPPRAIVFADAVIGIGGGRVGVAPISWGVRTPAGRSTYTRSFRRSISALLDRKPSILLPSHGKPVLTGGARALRTAVSAPAWGEKGV